MTDQPSPIWRDTLNVVADAISADSFRDKLVYLRERYGDSPNLIGWVYSERLTDWFVTSAGLLAALQLPPAKVPAALAEIRETLSNLDFEGEQNRLEQDDRRYHESFAQFAEITFPELGQAMESLLNCYVSSDYDPQANPNDLIAEALKVAEENLGRAYHLTAQAGAIALHARPLWWRWEQEGQGPLEHRLIATLTLVESYTSDGKTVLGPLEKARAGAERSLLEVREKIARLEKGMLRATEAADLGPSPVDDLVDNLIEQGEKRFMAEQLALCRDHREDAIPALIGLAADEYLQLEESPGDGYAPIRAVELLGELKAVEAIPELIDIVADTDPETIIYNAAIQALQKIGQPVREQILTFMRYSWDAEAKVRLAEAIGVSGPDEQVYHALVEVWEEATWEEGKCLLAYRLAQAGGEQAIPLLEAALEDPELDPWDYNEVAYALEDLGVKVDTLPVDLEKLGLDMDIEGSIQTAVSEISDPAHLMEATSEVPEEWHLHPDDLAHAYADLELSRMSSMWAMQAIILPAELSLSFTDILLEAAKNLAFDAPTKEYPRWLRQTYDHLAECAGPKFRDQLIGVLLSLHYYLSDDYDITDEPDQLLAAASELSESEDDVEKLYHLFGQAGALVLHGRPFWPRWPDETDPPLSNCMEGLVRFHTLLESVGQIPLRPASDMPPEELTAALLEAATDMEEMQPSPAVGKLLNTILTQEQGTLSPAQRRRFSHQRAAVIPYLILMVKDKQYWYEEGPGGGWAAILAVRLLGELKASQAGDALVSIVADSDPEDVIHEAALFSLLNIGRPALSAVQSYFLYGRKVETKTTLAEALGCIGRRNTGDFDLLRQVWEAADWAQNRRMVALAFGDLRDRRAIPLLQASLEDRRTDALDQEYISWALQRLGVQEPPKKKSSRLKTPASHSPRLIYDEFDVPQRSKYTPWGEPLCPDCGKPFVLSKDGEWIHPPERKAHRPAPKSKKRRRKKRKR